jgi:3-dehydroquinate synthase
VLIDPGVLATLPDRDYLSGVGEILKTSCLDASFFPWLEQHWTGVLTRDIDTIDEAIARCVRIKSAIVAADPTEQGVRRQLNLGHTMGHAYEAYWEGRIPHGLCIALGLAVEAGMGLRLGFSDPDYARRIEELATSLLALPAADFPEGPPPPFASMLPLLEADKKRLPSGLIRWQIPIRPGVVEEHLIRADGTEVPTASV